MNVSSRNTFYGKIIAITASGLNDEVAVQLEGGEVIYGQISHASTLELGLEIGRPAAALVKATEILLLTENEGWKFSSRNQFTGKIVKLVRGFVNSEVLLETPGGVQINASVTLDGVNRLKLERGRNVTAAFKASNVVIAVKD